MGGAQIVGTMAPKLWAPGMFSGPGHRLGGADVLAEQLEHAMEDVEVAEPLEHEVVDDDEVAKPPEHEVISDVEVAPVLERDVVDDAEVAPVPEHVVVGDVEAAPTQEHEVSGDEEVAPAPEHEVVNGEGSDSGVSEVSTQAPVQPCALQAELTEALLGHQDVLIKEGNSQHIKLSHIIPI